MTRQMTGLDGELENKPAEDFEFLSPATRDLLDLDDNGDELSDQNDANQRKTAYFREDDDEKEDSDDGVPRLKSGATMRPTLFGRMQDYFAEVEEKSKNYIQNDQNRFNIFDFRVNFVQNRLKRFLQWPQILILF